MTYRLCLGEPIVACWELVSFISVAGNPATAVKPAAWFTYVVLPYEVAR